MTIHSYLTRVFSISLGIFIIVGGFNYIINPYNIHNTERITGINTFKPEAAKRIRTFKKYQPFHIKPNTLILGNSRVEMGINPKHKNLTALGNVYNLGIPGMRFKDQATYANLIIQSEQITTLIIGIDFSDDIFRYDEVKKTLNTTKTVLWLEEPKDKLSSLWSLDAIKSSISTLINQHSQVSNRYNNGFNPANDYLPILKLEGQKVLFKQKMKTLDQVFKDKYWLEKMTDVDKSRLGSNVAIQVKQWLKQGIHVHVFINPYHNDYYQKLKEHNLFTDFNLWRQQVSQKLSRLVTFCDFTELGKSKSNERLNNNELRYFWEPSHYKKELGDIMLPLIMKGCNSV